MTKTTDIRLPSPIFIESCASTNLFVQENSHLFQENFSAVFCREQLMGKGRHNRSWQMEANKDIAFSFVYFPTEVHVAPYTLITGLAVARALDSYTNKHFIKWPNDIMIKNAKLGGILTEYTTLDKRPALVVGIGINVNSKRKNIEQKNTSLIELTDSTREIDLSVLLQELLYSVKIHFVEYKFPFEENFISEWLERCNCLQKKVYVSNAIVKRKNKGNLENCKKEISAFIVGLDEQGRLLLQFEKEIIALHEGTLRFS